EWLAAYLTLSYDFGWAALRSYTGYRDGESEWHWDLDGSPTANIILLDATVPQTTFTQEVNLTSTGESRLQWLAGIFYFDDKSDYQLRETARGRQGAETQSWAVYADATLQ